MHGIVLASHYHIVQKYNNKERSKTMRNLTKPCINLSEYWTSMKVASRVGKGRLTKPLKRLLVATPKIAYWRAFACASQISKESTNNWCQNLFWHFALKKSLSDIIFAFPLPLPSCNVAIVLLFELPGENNKHPNFEWRGRERGVDWFVLWSYPIHYNCFNNLAGLSLRAGGRGFSPATKRVAPGYFYRKIEEK